MVGFFEFWGTVFSMVSSGDVVFVVVRRVFPEFEVVDGELVGAPYSEVVGVLGSRSSADALVGAALVSGGVDDGGVDEDGSEVSYEVLEFVVG